MTTQPRPTRQRMPRRRRATVMFEALLILPFIVLILLLMLYLGNAMLRMQSVHLVDRYEAWRRVENAPGPRADATMAHSNLNQIFLRDTATNIGVSGHNNFPQDAPQQLIDVAAGFSNLAQDMVREAHDRFDRGRGVSVTVQYHHDVSGPLARFNTPIHHSHTRLGTDWKFANYWRIRGENYTSDNVHGGDWGEDYIWRHRRHGSGERSEPWMTRLVIDTHLEDFDNGLANIADQNNAMASYLRNLYFRIPPYRGPLVTNTSIP